MIADFFTKPLQGALFNKFRAVIMGWEHIDTISPSGNKERVGESVFQDKEMSTASAVEKSYTDAVKNNCCMQTHIDGLKSHPSHSSRGTTIQQATSK